VIALPVLPQQAYANIEALRTNYPGIYTADGGFYDAVDPSTGAIGHRRLVLDQSMIMAALDDALNNGALQRHFADDPVSWAARTYWSTTCRCYLGAPWGTSSSTVPSASPHSREWHDLAL
jgi:hypothetical protein